MAYRWFMTIGYPRVREIIHQDLGSALIYLNSQRSDFQNPELRPYLDKYVRGSKGYDAVERVKLMKLIWDSVGTEFAGRHELYERNYSGNHENVRIEMLTAQRHVRAGGRLEGVRRAVPGRVRPRRLDRPGPDQPRSALTWVPNGRRASPRCGKALRSGVPQLSTSIRQNPSWPRLPTVCTVVAVTRGSSATSWLNLRTP